jgi:hypothetical protein
VCDDHFEEGVSRIDPTAKYFFCERFGVFLFEDVFVDLNFDEVEELLSNLDIMFFYCLA